MIVHPSLSDQLGILAESVAVHLSKGTVVPIGSLYASLIKARDDAVLLEARAGARDMQIHDLIAQVEAECTRLAALRAASREGNMQ